MNSDSIYVKGIQSRSEIRFWVGFFARLKNYFKYRRAVRIARRNGAVIGNNVSLPLSLAKRANSNLKIGDHTSIQTDELDLRAPIEIGNFVIIGSGVKILTCSHDVDSPNWEFKSYGITIGDFAWIATDVLILPSCKAIKKGAVIGAGSVLYSEVDEMAVVSGNPAKIFRKRKEVHYNLCVEGLLGNDLITYYKVRKKNVF